MRQPTPAGLLREQFFRRLLDNDLVSPQSDGRQNLGVVLGVLASPGILYTALLLLIYFNPLTGPAQRLMFALSDKVLLITAPMLLMAVITVIEWDALGMDARDLAILGPLPLRHGVVIRAKLASLARFVILFAVAANLVPTLVFPPLIFGNLPIGLGRVLLLIGAHALISVAATAFAFLAVLAAREVLRGLLGLRLFRRFTTAVQFVLVLGLVTALLLGPVLASHVQSLLASGGLLVYAFPPLWFIGAYEVLTGPLVLHAPGLDRPQPFELWTIAANDPARLAYESYAPSFHQLASFAAIGLVVVALIGIGGHLLHARDATRLVPAVRRRRSRLGNLVGEMIFSTIVRNPASQAGFFFTLQTLARSPVHRLYLAGHLALGVAVSALLVASASARGGLTRGAPPSVFLLAVPMVLSFLVIVGLRHAFAVPAELRANWVFQLYAGPQGRRYLAGVRRAVQVTVIPALVALFVPVSAVLWGVPRAGVHLAAGLLASWTILEVALVPLRNLPFTCSHVPGSANLKTWWPVYAASFAGSTVGFALVERAALRSAAESAILLIVLLIAFAAAIGWRRFSAARQGNELIFEELPEDRTQELGLQALW